MGMFKIVAAPNVVGMQGRNAEPRHMGYCEFRGNTNPPDIDLNSWTFRGYAYRESARVWRVVVGSTFTGEEITCRIAGNTSEQLGKLPSSVIFVQNDELKDFKILCRMNRVQFDAQPYPGEVAVSPDGVAEMIQAFVREAVPRWEAAAREGRTPSS